MQHDVIIIGCGPVGALAANLLGHEGLSALVLERQDAPYPLPRAVHIDHEMLRLCQTAGVIDRVLPDMRETDGHLHVGADHGVIRYMGTVGKPRPYGWANDYFFYQPEMEAHLRDALSRLDKVRLETGAEFVSLEQDGDGVAITYRQGGKTHRASSRWLIACDGASSPVRKAVGIALDDLDFEEPWLVVDAEVEGEVQFPDLSGVPEEADLQRLSVMMCDPKRPATVVPGRRNHRRWEFMLLPGEGDSEMMGDEQVARLLEPYLGDVPHRVTRAATYRFHGLVAEQWQAGRAFLAGDAAHQTPPFFGQGMCHGFRDVANLSWKMAAIAQGRADEAILKSYQPERDPHVRAVIGAAVGAGRYICMLDPAQASERDEEMRGRPTFGQSETAADLIPAITTGLILADSPAAGTRFIQPRLDDGKMLDDAIGGGWRLFVRDDTVAGDAVAGISRVNAATLNDDGVILEWLNGHGVDAVLVRPDHYVFGSAADSVADLLAARDRALGEPHTFEREPA